MELFNYSVSEDQKIASDTLFNPQAGKEQKQPLVKLIELQNSVAAAVEGPFQQNQEVQQLLLDLKREISRLVRQHNNMTQAHSGQLNVVAQEAQQVRDLHLRNVRTVFANLPPSLQPHKHEIDSFDFPKSTERENTPPTLTTEIQMYAPLEENPDTLAAMSQMRIALSTLFEVRQRIEYKVGLQLDDQV